MRYFVAIFKRKVEKVAIFENKSKKILNFLNFLDKKKKILPGLY